MPACQQKLRPGWTTTVFKLRLLAAAATFLFSSSKGRRTGSKAGAPVALAGSRLSDVSLLLSYSSLDPDVKVNHRYGAAVTTSTTIFVCPAPVSLLFLLIAGAREGHRMGYRGTDETASAVHCIESIFLLFFSLLLRTGPHLRTYLRHPPPSNSGVCVSACFARTIHQQRMTQRNKKTSFPECDAVLLSRPTKHPIRDAALAHALLNIQRQPRYNRR